MPVRFAETVQQLVSQFILCQKEAVITERKTCSAIVSYVRAVKLREVARPWSLLLLWKNRR